MAETTPEAKEQRESMTTTPKKDRPPGPRGLPLIGNAGQAGRGLFEFITENARTYGDVVYFEIVNEPFYQLNHPDDIESVLVENNQQFSKGHLNRELLNPVFGTGLFTSERETWRDQRHLIQPLFHPDQIAVYGNIMTECTERMLDEWSDEKRIDVHEAMKGFTLEIVARALFGVDIRRDIRSIGRTLDIILRYIDSTSNLLLPSWAPLPRNRRYRRAITELESIVDRIITERRTGTEGDDVVSKLLAAENERGGRMSTRQLRDEVMTFLIAGHETTAATLTYAWYLLATHPGVEQRLVGELATVLDGDSPSVAEVSKLTFTDHVITETMRLFPPANRIHREPVEDVVIRGYQISAGATVVLPQWVVHRDPRWYRDPLAFYPERWTDEFRTRLPRLAYFPFGAGPRRCIGDRFARLEAILVLATILQRYHLELPPETSLQVEPAVTTRPKHPLWMTVHERTELPLGGRKSDAKSAW